MTTIYHVRNWCEDCVSEKRTIQSVLDDTWKAPGCEGHTCRDFCVENNTTYDFHLVRTDASSFIEQTIVSFVNVGYIIFPGTDAGALPTKFSAIANVLGGQSFVRLYDPVAAKTIATLGITNTGLGITETTTLTDLPATETILQIQIRGDGTNWLRYYSAELVKMSVFAGLTPRAFAEGGAVGLAGVMMVLYHRISTKTIDRVVEALQNNTKALGRVEGSVKLQHAQTKLFIKTLQFNGKGKG